MHHFFTKLTKLPSNNSILQNNAYIYSLSTGKLSSRSSKIFSTNNSISYEFDPQDRLKKWKVNNMDEFTIEYDNFGSKTINSVITASATDELSYMSDAKFNLDDHTSSVGFSETTNYDYTNQNRIASLSEQNTDIANAGLDFTYGADMQRRTMSILQGTQTLLKKRYFMNYEEHEENGQVTKKVYYIDGAVLVKENNTDKLYFTLNDYDGSIQALVNTNGTLAEQYAYDPWGKRVKPSDWITTDTRTSFIQDRGFTGHEHIDQFGIINMNARLYDPFVGTFMQPDPYMQDITNPINFNRYSYCLNNPLRYTDPSGERFEWQWLSTWHWFVKGMQWINDNTVGLRQDMMNLGIPDFSVGVNYHPSDRSFSNDQVDAYRALQQELDIARRYTIFEQSKGRYFPDFSLKWDSGKSMYLPDNTSLSGLLGDVWNSKIMRLWIPDVYVLTIPEINIVEGRGIGLKPLQINFMTRGQDIGIHITGSTEVKNGVHIDGGIIGWGCIRFDKLNVKSISKQTLKGDYDTFGGDFKVIGASFNKFRDPEGNRIGYGLSYSFGIAFGVSWGKGITRLGAGSPLPKTEY